MPQGSLKDTRRSARTDPALVFTTFASVGGLDWPASKMGIHKAATTVATFDTRLMADSFALIVEALVTPEACASSRGCQQSHPWTEQCAL